jgi:hypothetical protein
MRRRNADLVDRDLQQRLREATLRDREVEAARLRYDAVVVECVAGNERRPLAEQHAGKRDTERHHQSAQRRLILLEHPFSPPLAESDCLVPERRHRR